VNGSCEALARGGQAVRSDRLHRRDLGKKMPDVDPQDRHPALQSMCSKD